MAAPKSTPAMDKVKADLRKFMRENKGMYKRAQAILDDPNELRIYEESALNMIRMYNIGDGGELAIGLISAARQLLATVDKAREDVTKFKDVQKRLEDIEKREEDSEEPEEL